MAKAKGINRKELLTFWRYTSEYLTGRLFEFRMNCATYRYLESLPRTSEEDDIQYLLNAINNDFKDHEFTKLLRGHDEFERVGRGKVSDSTDSLLEEYRQFMANFLQKGEELSERIDVKDFNQSKKIIEYCWYTKVLYYSFSTGAFICDSNEFGILCKLEGLCLSVLTKMYEFEGYWLAKMEERRRNLKSASRRKLIKLDNMKKVQELFSKYPREKVFTDKRIRSQFMADAILKTDYSERTIMNYLKELAR